MVKKILLAAALCVIGAAEKLNHAQDAVIQAVKRQLVESSPRAEALEVSTDAVKTHPGTR